MDYPVARGLDRLLDDFDRLVDDCGGRVYLVKDSRLSPGMFRKFYGESFAEWLEIKKKTDPEWRFDSDLARRLRFREGV